MIKQNNGSKSFIGGVLVSAAIFSVIVIVLFFVVSRLPAAPSTDETGTALGTEMENPIESEADVGDSVITVGMTIQEITSLLKDLDDKIA